MKAGLSLRQAGRLLGVTDTSISHMENGKMKLPYARIEQMVAAYGQTMNEFFRLSRAKVLPVNYREECESLLKRVPTQDLETVVSFLRKIAVNKKIAQIRGR
jgi:transcriptional regulator with XRE-family HTH domain